MKLFQQFDFRKALITATWVLLSGVGLLLLVAAIHRKESKLCTGTEIEIKGLHNNFFIDKSDVEEVISKHAGGSITGKPVEGFDLIAIEKALKREVWISKAEMYFDNNALLHANITEREPMARIFTMGGQSYYIDQTGMMLPLSDKLSARVPIFTNFPSETKVLSKADSNLLKDIQKMGAYIQKDSFLYAMIDQVAINNQREFELVPKMGDQLIVFGDANDMEQKFDKLKLFYKKVMPATGWGRYHTISLQYKNQVVGKIRGKEDVKADSMQTLQIMKTIAAYASRMASDSSQAMAPDNEKNSTQLSLIMESLQRDEAEDASGAGEGLPPLVIPVVAPAKTITEKKPEKPAIKPVSKPVEKAVVKKPAPVVIKKAGKDKPPVVKKTAAKPVAPKPKAVMPAKPKNDY